MTSLSFSLLNRLTAEGGKHPSASMFDFMVKVIIFFITKLPNLPIIRIFRHKEILLRRSLLVKTI